MSKLFKFGAAVLMVLLAVIGFAGASVAPIVVSQNGIANIYAGSYNNQQVINTNILGVPVTQYSSGAISYGDNNVQAVNAINKGSFVTANQQNIAVITNGNGNNQNVGSQNTASFVGITQSTNGQISYGSSNTQIVNDINAAGSVSQSASGSIYNGNGNYQLVQNNNN